MGSVRPVGARVFLLSMAGLAFLATLMLAPAFALLVAPAALMLITLLSGVIPGEDWIVRRRRGRPAAPLRRARRTFRRPRAPLVACRAGWLNAYALAMRPPPPQPALNSR